ncbi:hypothetical protein JOC77_000944 [Peribacillus deserti]|uniref:Uncharacterized protein n=1 Tax=Peribacillus deserti TaxID=673318 RepID=A0ABS2QEF9_9BACI|nr:hypothetical protein [Peribacillus deserti]MBM7691537.1 hypothetical protein [Peribacillus deserti]
MVSVAFSFSKSTLLFKRTSFIFITAGIGIMIFYKLPLIQIPVYFNRMGIMISLFVVLPFMNSIIRVGNYDRNVNKLLKFKTHNLSQMYYRGSLTSYIIGMFLNIGVIPFVHQVIERNPIIEASHFKQQYLSSLILRGYTLCLIWSPMEILVGLTIDVTHVSYYRILPYLFTLSVLMLTVDWQLSKRYKKYILDPSVQFVPFNKLVILKNIVYLFIHLFLFIAAVTVVKNYLHLNFLTSVTLTILPYAIFWAITINKLKPYLKYSVMVWERKTASLQNYIVLFLGLGFFISVLEESDLLKYLQSPVAELSKVPIVLFLVIQILFLLLAMGGFHPLVTMAIIGEALQPAAASLNPVSLSIVLITSSLSTVMSGPYNISVSLMSMLLKDNPYRVSLYNIKFALLFSSAGTFLALLLEWLQ